MVIAPATRSNQPILPTHSKNVKFFYPTLTEIWVIYYTIMENFQIFNNLISFFDSIQIATIPCLNDKKNCIEMH